MNPPKVSLIVPVYYHKYIQILSFYLLTMEALMVLGNSVIYMHKKMFV